MPAILSILDLTKMSTWSLKLCQSAVKQEKHFEAAPASGLRVKVNVRKNWREIGKHANYLYQKLDSPEITNVMVLTQHLESRFQFFSFCKLIEKNFHRHKIFNRKSLSWNLRKRASRINALQVSNSFSSNFNLWLSKEFQHWVINFLVN